MKLHGFAPAMLVFACLGFVAGCTFDTSLLPDSDVNGEAVWLEPDQTGELLCAVLPDERGDAPVVTVLASPPDWYVGPGLYVPGVDGYTREVDGAELTLDDVLMVWNAGPAAEQAIGAGE